MRLPRVAPPEQCAKKYSKEGTIITTHLSLFYHLRSSWRFWKGRLVNVLTQISVESYNSRMKWRGVDDFSPTMIPYKSKQSENYLRVKVWISTKNLYISFMLTVEGKIWLPRVAPPRQCTKRHFKEKTIITTCLNQFTTFAKQSTISRRRVSKFVNTNLRRIVRSEEEMTRGW